MTSEEYLHRNDELFVEAQGLQSQFNADLARAEEVRWVRFIGLCLAIGLELLLMLIALYLYCTGHSDKRIGLIFLAVFVAIAFVGMRLRSLWRKDDLEVQALTEKNADLTRIINDGAQAASFYLLFNMFKARLGYPSMVKLAPLPVDDVVKLNRLKELEKQKGLRILWPPRGGTIDDQIRILESESDAAV